MSRHPADQVLKMLSRSRAAATTICVAAAGYLAVDYFGWWSMPSRALLPLAAGVVLCAIAALLACVGWMSSLRLRPTSESLPPDEAAQLVTASSATPVASEEDAAAVIEAVAAAMAGRGYRVRTGPRVAEVVSPGWNHLLVPGLYALLALALLVTVVGRATRVERTVDLPLGDGVIAQVGAPSTVDVLTRGLMITAIDLVEAPDGTGTAWLTVASPDELLANRRLGEKRPVRIGSLLLTWQGRGVSAVLTVETSAGSVASRLPFLLEYPSSGTAVHSSSTLTAFSEVGIALADLRVGLDVPEEVAPLRAVPTTATAMVSIAPAGTTEFGPATPLELGQWVPLGEGYHLRFVVLDDWIRIRVTEDRWSPLAAALLALATFVLISTFFVAPRRAIVGAVRAESGNTVNVLVTGDAPMRAFSRRVRAEVEGAAARVRKAAAGGEHIYEDGSDEQ